MDISVTIKDFELKCSMWYPNALLEGSVSQNFNLGPSFYYMGFGGNITVLDEYRLWALEI